MAVHEKLSIVVAFTLTSLSTAVVALRFYSRYFLVGKLSSPDWMMLLAMLATWSSAVCNYYQVRFLDYSEVDSVVQSEESYARVVVGGLLTFWIYRINYILNLCLVKTSILLFYNYVASSHQSFQLIVKALLTIVVSGSLAMFIAGIFACYPVEDAWSFEVFWNSYLGIHASQCYNPTVPWLFNAGFNLFTDVFIWVLPILFFLNLQSMPVRRRLELVGIFSIGIMAIVASAIRLWTLVGWLSDWEKQGENTANLLIWSQVEQHAGIISGSIPFLRPLFRKALSKMRQCHQRDRASPSPGMKLIQGQLTPDNNGGNPIPLRPPIIPSPSPTLGSSHEPFRAPNSPLAPVASVRSAIYVGGSV